MERRLRGVSRTWMQADVHDCVDDCLGMDVGVVDDVEDNGSVTSCELVCISSLIIFKGRRKRIKIQYYE